mgnify:FL=1
MPRSKLFESWTWNRALPAPFDSLPNAARTDVHSKYNNMTGTPRATIHSMTIAAILAYMDIDTSITPGATGNGAIGTQGNNLTMAEYHSRIGEIHVVVFNKTTGKFIAGCYSSPSASPTVYTVKDGKNTGTASFLRYDRGSGR